MSVLQLKARGAEVMYLQQQLIKLGYTLAADGLFGDETQAAVLKFQVDHQLAADGIAGLNTINQLNFLSPPVTIKGIDVSHHNGPINWSRISSDIRFAICKATQGSGFKDGMFADNLRKLEAAGIIRGAYHFLTFKSPAAAQIQNFLDCGVDFSKPGVLPPVVDIEWQGDLTLDAYIKSNRQVCIQLIRDWLNGIEAKTGRIPMIYTNSNFWSEFLLNPSGFEKYPLWISAYQSSKPQLPPGWPHYTIWQNSDKGVVIGIGAPVDINLFNGGIEELNTLAQVKI